MTRRAVAFAGLAALMLAPIACAPVMWEKPDAAARDTYQLRAWTLYNAGEAEGRTAGHRLVGLACGPDRLTMTATEEDQFPVEGCERIDTPENLCGLDAYGEAPLAWECAAYLGDGW